MNEKFKTLVKNTNKSLRKISLETGIPYTVLNELNNDKKNINHITCETVFKLSLYFDCNIDELLNAASLIKNSQGQYMGIGYKWIAADSGAQLHIYDENDDIILTTISQVVPRFYSHYKTVAEMLIEKYVRQKQIEQALL